MSAQWCWPLRSKTSHPLPVLPAPGAFSAERKHDVHTGVDLYCEPGAVVVAVEAGTVVAIEAFTGEAAGSPWWFDTDAVLVEGASGVVVYGEVLPTTSVGATVQQGEVLGKVVTVLKKDKGLSQTMLHLELYQRGARTTVWWLKNQPKPESLLDPTQFLSALCAPC